MTKDSAAASSSSRGDKKQRKLEDKERVLGKYSKKDNPWNDPHLDKVFVWRKRAASLNMSTSEAKREAKARREANIIELDQAKKRREQRELELQERVAEKDRQRRDRDGDNFETLARNEKQFLSKQRRQVCVLHVNAGREEPSDTLARNALLLHQMCLTQPEVGPDGKLLPRLEDYVGPWTGDALALLKALPKQAVEQVKTDLALILQGIEPASYVRCILVVCEDRLAVPNLHISAQVDAALVASCAGRTVAEIASERVAASAKAKGSEYWTAVASRLAVEEAKAELVEIQRDLVSRLHGMEKFDHNPPRPQEDNKLKEQPEHLVGATNKISHSRHHAVEEACEDEKPVSNSGMGLRKAKTWNRIRKDVDRRGHPYISGYRFNILYPGATTTPSFELSPSPYRSGMSLITFKAGGYEDICYEIPNADWEKNSRSNFTSKFEKDTLHLYFDFRRVGFRR